MRKSVLDKNLIFDVLGIAGASLLQDTPAPAPTHSDSKDNLPVKGRGETKKAPEISSYRHKKESEKPKPPEMVFTPKENIKQSQTERRKEKFDFSAYMKSYDEKRRKGKQTLTAILSALKGNEDACSHVKLYFESASVQWDIQKFKQHLLENIEFWTEMREKYGDKGIANYSRAIATNEFILQRLTEEKFI